MVFYNYHYFYHFLYDYYFLTEMFKAFAVFFHICTVIDVETNDLLNLNILNEGFTTIHIFTIENEIGFYLENND